MDAPFQLREVGLLRHRTMSRSTPPCSDPPWRPGPTRTLPMGRIITRGPGAGLRPMPHKSTPTRRRVEQGAATTAAMSPPRGSTCDVATCTGGE